MLGETEEDELKEEEKPFAYNFQPVWKRFLIVFSGPLFNILFAIVIFFFSFVYGLPVLVPEIGDIMPDTPAAKAGLMKQDRIMEINGVHIDQWDEMTEIIHQNPGNCFN